MVNYLIGIEGFGGKKSGNTRILAGPVKGEGIWRVDGGSKITFY